MRLDSSLNIALNEQGCLRYPGPKTGYRRVLGLTLTLTLTQTLTLAIAITLALTLALALTLTLALALDQTFALDLAFVPTLALTLALALTIALSHATTYPNIITTTGTKMCAGYKFFSEEGGETPPAKIAVLLGFNVIRISKLGKNIPFQHEGARMMYGRWPANPTPPLFSPSRLLSPSRSLSLALTLVITLALILLALTLDTRMMYDRWLVLSTLSKANIQKRLEIFDRNDGGATKISPALREAMLNGTFTLYSACLGRVLNGRNVTPMANRIDLVVKFEYQNENYKIPFLGFGAVVPKAAHQIPIMVNNQNGVEVKNPDPPQHKLDQTQTLTIALTLTQALTLAITPTLSITPTPALTLTLALTLALTLILILALPHPSSCLFSPLLLRSPSHSFSFSRSQVQSYKWTPASTVTGSAIDSKRDFEILNLTLGLLTAD